MKSQAGKQFEVQYFKETFQPGRKNGECLTIICTRFHAIPIFLQCSVQTIETLITTVLTNKSAEKDNYPSN